MTEDGCVERMHRQAGSVEMTVCSVSDWQHWMEGKRTTTKTDSELALNAVRESLTTRKTADQSSSLSYINTDSSVPASETEVR